ncbi:MAG: hypothetical protein L6R40_006408 [Gallowayella cf. fulva]|nr:MAG: hypothetical protein L6R40_006408 [Xanthomendoza cf. fulva]
MDFIEGIGQRYLAGKANAVPQQLEALVKKQLKSDSAPAPAKGGTTAPLIGRNSEIEELRKQLAEVKAVQNKGQETKRERRQSIESVASRGRSRKPRAEGNHEKPFRSSHVPHHHTMSERPSHKKSATGKAREAPAERRSSSANALTAASIRSNIPMDHQEAHKPRSNLDGISHSASSNHDRVPHTAGSFLTEPNKIDQSRPSHSTSQNVASEKPRPAADFCVVEVTEEAASRQRRPYRDNADLVEVVEKRGNRTRYVVT